MKTDEVRKINSLYWDTTGNEFLGAIVLPFYGAFVSEEKCRLFGDLTGKKMLEIGCGNGGSLRYVAERGAAELWGMDISENQLAIASQSLKDGGLTARLICSPMEKECGIPKDYFDFVYSVYAIGWTVDLEGTFRKIASYLKKDGVFIFSWTHPLHKCIELKEGVFQLNRSYFDEAWNPAPLNPLDEGELLLSNRKLSTYINALVKAGFAVEQMVEETDDELLRAYGDSSDFAKKAEMYPLTFVIKARKL